jgi:hypothetical protein
MKEPRKKSRKKMRTKLESIIYDKLGLKDEIENK